MIDPKQRTVIIGAPRAGKTTLANETEQRTGVRTMHTDDLIGKLVWSVSSDRIADAWLAETGPWVIEGVAAVRGLRKWLERNRSGKPCDAVVLLWAPRLELTKKQESMAKSIRTVWDQIRDDLEARGVEVKHGD